MNNALLYYITQQAQQLQVAHKLPRVHKLLNTSTTQSNCAYGRMQACKQACGSHAHEDGHPRINSQAKARPMHMLVVCAWPLQWLWLHTKLSISRAVCSRLSVEAHARVQPHAATWLLQLLNTRRGSAWGAIVQQGRLCTTCFGVAAQRKPAATHFLMVHVRDTPTDVLKWYTQVLKESRQA